MIGENFESRDFPGSTEAGTLRFQCRVRGSPPLVGGMRLPCALRPKIKN